MNSKKLFLLITCIFFPFIVSCEDPISSPPTIPVEKLLAAPDTIEADGRKLILTSYLWRDFMPISPPDGKPLITLVYIETTDSTDIPALLEPKAVYVVNGNMVWSSFFENEEPPDSKSFRLTRIARDGPKWGPGILVDVIVLLSIGREEKLLRASDQYIGRTD